MTRLVSILALALLIPPLFGQEQKAPEGKKAVIGVMDFRAEGDLKAAAGILSDRLRARSSRMRRSGSPGPVPISFSMSTFNIDG